MMKHIRAKRSGRSRPLFQVMAAAVLAVGVLAAGPATAVPSGTLIESYRLGNHPDGSVSPPLYGLRLDGLFDGNANTIVTFSFDPADDPAVDMALDIYDDGGDLALFFHGTVFGGVDNVSTWDSPALYDVEMTYDNGDQDTTIALVNGFYVVTTGSNATIPVGTIQAQSGGAAYSLVGKADGSGLVFRLEEGHRGYPGLSGFGWINHSTGGLDNHLPASDWLFTATRVPEPTTLAMLGIGLLGLGFAGRRRATA